jgi:Nuclease-related domain
VRRRGARRVDPTARPRRPGALLVHLDHHQHDTARARPPRPVVAVRVRASVGRPGASAQATYRRRRAAERAAWVHTLPWRALALLVASMASWLVATQVLPHLAGLAVLVAAAGLGWLLRFRPAPTLWPGGAARLASAAPPRLLAPLERHGWAVLHDLAIAGSAANIDHLVIGPGGVVVIDSKQYRGAAAARPGRVVVARPPPAHLQVAEGPVGG